VNPYRPVDKCGENRAEADRPGPCMPEGRRIDHATDVCASSDTRRVPLRAWSVRSVPGAAGLDSSRDPSVVPSPHSGAAVHKLADLAPDGSPRQIRRALDVDAPDLGRRETGLRQRRREMNDGCHPLEAATSEEGSSRSPCLTTVSPLPVSPLASTSSAIR
jgi:hypothetical protein